MRKNKFGMYIILGSIVGAAVSLFDRGTRDEMKKLTKNVSSEISYYSKNPDVLKIKIKKKNEKLQLMYKQFTDDAYYLKEKVSEIKELSPQVKELVMDTKDAFTDAKDEYQSIVEDSTSKDLGKPLM